jgi:hypothetical protein
LAGGAWRENFELRIADFEFEKARAGWKLQIEQRKRGKERGDR